jgi:hypothetical protein
VEVTGQPGTLSQWDAGVGHLLGTGMGRWDSMLSQWDAGTGHLLGAGMGCWDGTLGRCWDGTLGWGMGTLRK